MPCKERGIVERELQVWKKRAHDAEEKNEEVKHFRDELEACREKLKSNEDIERELAEVRQELEGKTELENEIKQLAGKLWTAESEKNKATGLLAKMKTQVHDLKENLGQLSANLDIEQQKNEYLAGELKLALENKVSAEIQIDKLKSENILLQEEMTTFHIKGSPIHNEFHVGDIVMLTTLSW